MSTKTTFKRIALVAVAALGLGALSVAPSQAVVSGATLTFVQNGSATQTVSDTTTAALFTVSGLIDTPVGDSVTVQVVEKSIPSTAAATRVNFGVMETNTASGQTIYRQSSGGAAAGNISQVAGSNTYAGLGESATAGSTFGTHGFLITRAAAGYYGARFYVQIDSVTAPTAGTYTYTVITKTYSQAGAGTAVAIATSTLDVSIVVSASAAATALAGGTAIDPSKTTAILNAGAPTTFSAVDSAVAVVATAAATNHASIQVKTYTADSNPAPESVTATMTGAGVVCNSDASVCGKSLTLVGTGGDNTFRVRADGTAGIGSLVIKTTTVTFPAKTITFFAQAAKTITLAVNKPVIGIATTTDVIRAVAKDADGNVWGGAAYIYASTAADALIAGSNATPVACTYNSTYGYHECPVTGIAKGTANFKVIDAATVALATATSDAAAVRVSTGQATSAKIQFDKASYGPGDKAQVWVQVLDADGLPLAGGTAVTNAFAADIASSVAFSTGGTGLGGSASPTMAAATDADVPSVAGYAVYTVYMPFSSGDVTLTATGSTGLAASGRVAVSATASVVNSSVDAATDAANEATDAANAATDAALAAADAADAATAAAQDASDAVAELSASVTKLISSLRAQIKSLTNLVVKIQKKVKA